LCLSADLEPAQFLDPSSIGGTLALDSVTYTAGGTNLMNFGALPGGGNIRLGAAGNSTISSSVILIPDSDSRTLRFGNPGGGTLTVNAPIGNLPAGSVALDQDRGGTLALAASNSFAGQGNIFGGTLLASNA